MNLSRIGLFLAVLLLASTAAYADGTSTLTFLGPTYNGEYGPYTMSLNGGPSTQMICFSNQNWIQAGEWWTVEAFTPSPGLTSPSIPVGSLGGTVQLTSTEINELGYLADQLFANPGDADLQNQIWALFNSIVNGNPITVDGFSSTYQTTDTLYIPIPGKNSQNDPSGLPHVLGTPPQPFIVQTPEPSSLVLLGVGMLGLIALSLKKVVA